MLALLGQVRLFRMHEFWWGGFFPLIFTFLPIIAIIVGILIWSRDSHRHHHPMSPPAGWGPPQAPPPSAPAVDPALNEARLRYARGEISRDDYLRIATDLSGQAPPTA